LYSMRASRTWARKWAEAKKKDRAAL